MHAAQPFRQLANGLTMPTSDLFLSLLTFAAVATISPGGATTLAAASGTRFGMLRSIPLIAGIVIGMTTLIGSLAGGLGALAQSWPPLLLILRLIGSAYLLWLAWVIARQGAPYDERKGPNSPIGFVAGIVMLWVNPKAWMMAVAVAGPYQSLAASPMALAALLGSIFGLAGAISLTLWCAGGAWLSTFLKSQTQWRIANMILGLTLVASIIPLWR